MTSKRHSILCVDDEPVILNILSKLFEEKYQVYTAKGALEALELLQQHSVAVAIVDQKMPKITGVELLKRIKEQYPTIVRIVLTAYTDISDLVASINEGEIFRYITKPWDSEALMWDVHAAIEKYEENLANAQRIDDITRLQLEKEKLQKEIILLKSEIEKEYALDNIVSVSPSMNQIRRIIKAASLADETVLITGESGTGKELVARAIHHNSQRQNFPMVAVDCGALSESLLESELFGHVKGAFTGAVADRKGLFEEADGGTIFLDEISNTSLPLQARLLRVLQEREIRRIGDTKSRPVNVRVIAASNRDLVEECKTERFRSDLFYRLNVLPIALPPLRDRRDDIPLLINYFINEYNKKSAKSIVSISREAMDHLSSLEWKGNIRELKNIIHRMMVFAEGSHLEMGDIPDELLKVKRSAVVPVLPEGGTVFGVSALLPIEDMEREYIRFVLHQTGENKAEASKLLGMKRTTLVMRMKKLGLLA